MPAITQALQQALDGAPPPPNVTPELRQRLGQRKLMDTKLVPLKDAYFDREVADNPLTMPGPRGDGTLLKGLAAIALLILALAAMNYVNLCTVRILRRQREIALRKVLGAGGQFANRVFVNSWYIIGPFVGAGAGGERRVLRLYRNHYGSGA